MPEYTGLALVGVAGVVALDVGVLHTGLLTTRAYWISMGILYLAWTSSISS